MSNPLASIWEDRPVKPKAPPPKPQSKPVVDHSEARKLYEAFLVKRDMLKVHQAYADAVAKATDSPGMTPVKPLATMGCNGGPLLCDHCGKPIILEGGKYHKMYTDAAWKINPVEGWKSYISGGLVVAIVDNGTLRIYHGYDGMPDHCYTKAKAQLQQQEETHTVDRVLLNKVTRFLEDEGKITELSEVYSVMFSFDPGIGVNKP